MWKWIGVPIVATGGLPDAAGKLDEVMSRKGGAHETPRSAAWHRLGTTVTRKILEGYAE